MDHPPIDEIHSSLFPKLIEKHAAEIEAAPDAELLYHRQLHEIYTYEFLSRCKLEEIGEIQINEIRGAVLAPVRVKGFSLGGRVSEGHFFSFLLRAPLPFVFVPVGSVESFCRGIFSFRDGSREGVLMDLETACEFGVEFLAGEVLRREGVYSVFIGLLV